MMTKFAERHEGVEEIHGSGQLLAGSEIGDGHGRAVEDVDAHDRGAVGFHGQKLRQPVAPGAGIGGGQGARPGQAGDRLSPVTVDRNSSPA
jgi:hypothetical protein